MGEFARATLRITWGKDPLHFPLLVLSSLRAGVQDSPPAVTQGTVWRSRCVLDNRAITPIKSPPGKTRVIIC